MLKVIDGSSKALRSLLKLDADMLLTADYDKTLKFWKLRDGELVKTLDA